MDFDTNPGIGSAMPTAKKPAMSRFKRTFWIFLDLAAIFSATMMALHSLMLMGWMRHGSPCFDFGFLHFDWLLDTNNQYWKAHAKNHTFLFIAIGLLLFSLAHLSYIALSKNR